METTIHNIVYGILRYDVHLDSNGIRENNLLLNTLIYFALQ